MPHSTKNKNASLGKLALPTLEGFEFVDVSGIVRCEADGNYARIFLKEKVILISKTLKEIELKLKRHNFQRVHSHHLVNLSYASRYIKGNGGQLVLTNGTTVQVSIRCRKELLTALTNMV